MGFTRTNLKGLLGVSDITLSDNMTLQEQDRAFVLFVVPEASSKTLTLGLPDGACCIVINDSDIAFAVKNVSGDTGKDIAPDSVNLVAYLESAGLAVYSMSGGGR